jgi:hypothetical protein
MLAMLRRSVLSVAVLIVSFACGSSPTGPSDAGGGGSSDLAGSAGTLTVRITDSPFGAAKAVLVTFSEVSVRRGDNWTRVPFPDGASTWTCDLKKLENNAQDLLAVGSMPHAEYTWVRMTIQTAKLYGDNTAVSATPCARTIPEPAGSVHTMNLASREGSTNGSFPVTSTEGRTILLDFDGESSITKTGDNAYTMNPVIRLISVQ